MRSPMSENPDIGHPGSVVACPDSVPVTPVLMSPGMAADGSLAGGARLRCAVGWVGEGGNCWNFLIFAFYSRNGRRVAARIPMNRKQFSGRIVQQARGSGSCRERQETHPHGSSR